MDNKAQGALEYLLLIGGAVLIAAVVVGLLVSLSQKPTEAAGAAGNSINDDLENLKTLGGVS
ncbi:MAG: class III signal peptide-containing protein [Candidatus Diapherotrites archaeon]|nr:class III signal peptide-containing protein [Candidatus Diapherotrites archaeon]